jgi:ribosomal-protein-alanine N-acetyltransferase
MNITDAFSQFPILTTDRLRLRQVQSSDRAALFEMWSDPKATRYLQHLAHASVEDTDIYLHATTMRYQRREAITWAITFQDRDAELLGTCSLHHFGAGFRRAETGYALRPAYWGQGITHEAMLAVLDYGFSDLSLHRIEALIDDANTASKNLLLKLGFTYEGNLRERFLIGGTLKDEHYYGLLQREWQNRP